MKHFKQPWIIILISVLIFDSCKRNVDQAVGADLEKRAIVYDTSRLAILPFDSVRNYFFNGSFEPASITTKDLDLIDSIFEICVNDYNKSLSPEYFKIDVVNSNYRKQVIAVTNLRGEKEVWVNCFCSPGHSYWHHEIVDVEDGGNCYLNFKINLSTGKYYDLLVNGEA